MEPRLEKVRHPAEEGSHRGLESLVRSTDSTTPIDFSPSTDHLIFILRPTWLIMLEYYEAKAQEIAVLLLGFSTRLATDIDESEDASLSSLSKAFGKVHELCNQLHGDFDDRSEETGVISQVQQILDDGVQAFALAEDLAEQSLSQASQLSQEVRELKSVKIQDLKQSVTDFETIELPAAAERAKLDLKGVQDDIDIATRGITTILQAAASLRESKRKLKNKIPAVLDPAGILKKILKIDDKIKDCEREEANLNAQIAAKNANLEKFKKQFAQLEKASQERELGQKRIPELQEKINKASDSCEKTYSELVAAKQQIGFCYKKILECSVQARNEPGLKKRQLVDYILTLFEMGMFHPAVLESIRKALLELQNSDGPKGLFKIEFGVRVTEIWKKFDFMILGHDP